MEDEGVFIGSAEMKPQSNGTFDQSGNTYCWCVVGFHETSSCQNPCCFLWKEALWRKVSKKPAFPQVLLWTSDDYVLAHWKFQGLLCCSLSPSWLYPWWEDYDFENVCVMLVGCVLELLCPHKGPGFAGLVEVSGARASFLGWISGGSDVEQRFCEWPRRILVTFRCLTGAVSCLESSSRGCNCLQAPDRPHVLSGS